MPVSGLTPYYGAAPSRPARSLTATMVTHTQPVLLRVSVSLSLSLSLPLSVSLLDPPSCRCHPVSPICSPLLRLGRHQLTLQSPVLIAPARFFCWPPDRHHRPATAQQHTDNPDRPPSPRLNTCSTSARWLLAPWPALCVSCFTRVPSRAHHIRGRHAANLILGLFVTLPPDDATWTCILKMRLTSPPLTQAQSPNPPRTR